MKFNKWKKICIMGFSCFLQGCAVTHVSIQYSVLVPGEVQLDHINHLAILDFAVPHSQSTIGQNFSQILANSFGERSQYRITAPAYSREIIRRANIPLSRFRNPEIIRQIGNEIGAQALLFGDLSVSSTQRFEHTENIMQQIGVRRELETILDAAGNTQSFWTEIPIFEKIIRHTVHRIASVNAKARLVRVVDAFVLWEGDAEGQAIDEFTFDQGTMLRYQQRTDENLQTIAMNRAAEKLAQKFLPRQVLRRRQLLTLNEKSDYSTLITTGNDYAQKEDWQQAGRIWLQAIQLDKKRPQAYANLGVLHEGAQNYKDAIRYYQYASDQLGEPWLEYLKEVEKMIENNHFGNK